MDMVEDLGKVAVDGCADSLRQLIGEFKKIAHGGENGESWCPRDIESFEAVTEAGRRTLDSPTAFKDAAKKMEACAAAYLKCCGVFSFKKDDKNLLEPSADCGSPTLKVYVWQP